MRIAATGSLTFTLNRVTIELIYCRVQASGVIEIMESDIIQLLSSIELPLEIEFQCILHFLCGRERNHLICPSQLIQYVRLMEIKHFT